MGQYSQGTGILSRRVKRAGKEVQGTRRMQQKGLVMAQDIWGLITGHGQKKKEPRNTPALFISVQGSEEPTHGMCGCEYGWLVHG